MDPKEVWMPGEFVSPVAVYQEAELPLLAPRTLSQLKRQLEQLPTGGYWIDLIAAGGVAAFELTFPADEDTNLIRLNANRTLQPMEASVDSLHPGLMLIWLQ